MKIVINRCYGGFGLSNEAIEMYLDLRGIKYTKAASAFGTASYYINEGKDFFVDYDILRSDPALVMVVEALGEKANGYHANLKVEDIPAGTFYRIQEYDGLEHIETANDIQWWVAF